MKHPPSNNPRILNNATTWQLSVFESDLSATQKIICCYLRTHMNDYRDLAWPSVGRIADKCSLGERAVQNNLKAICEAGYLVNNGRSNLGTNMYAICTPALDAPPHLNTVTPAADAPELTKELTNTTTAKAKRFIKPTLEEVKAYAIDKKFTLDTDYFFEFYETAKWLDAGGKPVKNWKLKLLTWSKRENKNGNNPTGNASKPYQRKRTAAESAQNLRDRIASHDATMAKDERDVW